MILKKYSTAFLISIISLVILDLIIKAIVVSQFERTEMKEVIPGFLSIGRIETISLAGFRIQDEPVFRIVIRILFQVAMIALAIRIQKLTIHRWYQYATTMIALAIIGYDFDWIFFSHGNLSYLFTDYLWFQFLYPLVSITSILDFLGWVLFLISIVFAFRDLKVIFTFKSTT